MEKIIQIAVAAEGCLENGFVNEVVALTDSGNVYSLYYDKKTRKYTIEKPEHHP